MILEVIAPAWPAVSTIVTFAGSSCPSSDMFWIISSGSPDALHVAAADKMAAEMGVLVLRLAQDPALLRSKQVA